MAVALPVDPFALPLGELLVSLVLLAAIALVGRIVLSLVWKLSLVAIVVVGALYAVGPLL